MSLIMGVDGGGSKTCTVITDTEGGLLGEGLAGGANYQKIGLDSAMEQISTAMNQALAQAGVQHKDIDFVQYTLAGLRAGSKSNAGIVLVCGSGTNAFGRSVDGKVVQTGGFGYLYGDFAGGNHMAIIGCGEIAHIHAACILRNGGAIAGGFDLSEESARKLTAAFGGKPYLTAEELCADPSVDAVYICTRHDSHVAYIELAASRGKAVFCEKPIGLRLSDAEQAADIVDQSGILLAMGFNHRYSPGMQRLKQYIDQSGCRIDAMNAQFVTAPFMQGWAGRAEQGGGVFVCLGSHLFDLVHYLVPGPIQQVRAISSRIRLEPSYEDDAFGAVLLTEAGQLLTLNAHEFGNASFSTDPGHRINTITLFTGKLQRI